MDRKTIKMKHRFEIEIEVEMMVDIKVKQQHVKNSVTHVHMQNAGY